MGGEIGVESSEGEGSVFWFTAKLGKQDEESFYHRLPANYFTGNALVVDDNQTIRHLLVNYLREWGFYVEEAENGPDALSILRESKGTGREFDICLVDLLMPGMDGWQFASEVNSDEQLEETRLFLMSPTGKSGEEAKMKLLRWFEGYLSKPLKKAKLFQTLVRAFSEEGEEVEELAAEDEPVELVEEITGGIVLVAEDHEVNQQLFKTILENLGHEVHLAANGSEAVQAVKTQAYNIIFMDVQMPEMNGYEATEEIRRLGVKTPIVAVTASALKGEEAKSLEAGMDDFLVKPFKKKDLVPVMEKWMSAEKPPETPEAAAPAESAEPSESAAPAESTEPAAPAGTAGWAGEGKASAGESEVPAGKASGDAEEAAEVEELEPADEKVEELEAVDEEVEELEPIDDEEISEAFDGESGRRAAAAEESPPAEEASSGGESSAATDDAAGADEAAAADPIFDLDEARETFMGKEDVVKRVANSYIEKVRGQIPVMEAALQDGDWERLRGEAHSIKGGGLNLSVKRLGNTAAELEAAAAGGEGDRARRLFGTLKDEYRTFLRYCQEELGWELPES
jgi:CheY-like chemotaxis protein/HPt (histidine-containing phosphotransfer) domain-containing protein